MEFTENWVRERPGLGASEITRATLGRMSSDLFAARSALWAAADMWDAGDYDAAELASMSDAPLEVVTRILAAKQIDHHVLLPRISMLAPPLAASISG